MGLMVNPNLFVSYIVASGPNPSLYVSYIVASGPNPAMYVSYIVASGPNPAMYVNYIVASGPNPAMHVSYVVANGPNPAMYVSYIVASGPNPAMYVNYIVASGPNPAMHVSYVVANGPNPAMYVSYVVESGPNPAMYVSYVVANGPNPAMYVSYVVESGPNPAMYVSYVVANGPNPAMYVSYVVANGPNPAMYVSYIVANGPNPAMYVNYIVASGPYPAMFLVTLSACGSVSVLIVVAVDRFRRICRPFRKQMTVVQSKIIMGCTLVISITFSSPALVLYGRQTDVRFNHTVYDCSIDDTFRKSSFASGYQYVLGVTWVVCIIILVVMYGFIVFTIHQQKKRRVQLSANSCPHTGGGQALHSLKISITDTSTSDSPGAAPPLYGEAVPESDEVATNGMKYLAEDADNTGSSSRLIKEEDDNVDRKSLKRLFSRDVNPVLHDDSEHILNDDTLMSCDDVDVVVSWQENGIPSVTSSGTTNESLNNCLDCSRETDFMLGYEVSTGIIDDVKMSPNPATHLIRSRKHGHYFGRYRPWESMYSSSHVTRLSQWERDWISNSFPSLDAIKKVKNFSGVRRASSVPCLVNFSIGNSLVEKQKSIGGSESNVCLQKDVRDRGEESQVCIEKQTLTNNCCDFSCQSLNSLHNLSNVNEDDITQRKPKNSTVTWCSLQIPANSCQTNGSIKSSQLSLNKMRSASTITLRSQKRSLGREIKTSRISIMMLLVTLGFVLSYLPHLFLQIYSAVFRDEVANWLCPRSTPFIFYHLFFRSFFINNSINPIIYSFYNKTFRSHCLRFIRAPKSLMKVSTIDCQSSASQDNDTS
ncbi:hypothetical protein Btru_028424 [Bulinus truncatus]|nr:hypothetical protein Btru_028424 [Bulinus truncatus]